MSRTNAMDEPKDRSEDGIKFLCTYKCHSQGDMHAGPGTTEIVETADFKQALNLLLAADDGNIWDLTVEQDAGDPSPGGE